MQLSATNSPKRLLAPQLLLTNEAWFHLSRAEQRLPRWVLLGPVNTREECPPQHLPGGTELRVCCGAARHLRWGPAAGTDHAAQPGQHLPRVLQAQTFSLISGTASVFHNAHKRKNHLTTYNPHDVFRCSQVALDHFPPTKGPPSRRQLSSPDFLPLLLCLSSSLELLQVSL